MKIKYILIVSVIFITTVTINAQENSLPKGFWKIPNSSVGLKIGGYVKLDLIHDFDKIDSPYFFDVSKISMDQTPAQKTNLNSRESRLFFDFRAPDKDLKTYFELDFYGTNGAFRLRHAYLSYKGWTVGQTWSNFMDENIIPATLDFEKPLAYAFARHSLIQYKMNLSSSSYLAFALEQPSAKGQIPLRSGEYQSPFPDLTARYRITEKWGHVQLSGYLATVRFQYDQGDKDDLLQSGVNLSSKVNFGSSTYAIGQIIYGKGITRYRGGNSVGLDLNGNLTSINELAYTIGLQQKWTDKLSTLAVYNSGILDNADGQPGTDIKMTSYYAINLTYHILPETSIGIEFLSGRLKNENDSKGTANRLQFSFKQVIN